ncbi:MAG: hypothetical protein IKE53_10055 [Clostridiales bacterium]|nr:hypothetical protein [Clostridiales bacterium]
MGKPLLEYISEALTADNTLPEDFKLPKNSTDNEIRFADGALDGITIYHSAFPVIEDQEKEEILNVLRTAEKEDYGNAAEGFSKILRSHRAIVLIDDIQSEILAHTDELSVQKMVQFASILISTSEERELVKTGLIILELVDTSVDPELIKSIRTLGTSDEFTIFSVFIMRHWPNGQMEILDLAKRVHGWGRIHCVYYLEPENDEIRQWLMTDGTDNYVMPEYSALTVFRKTGMEEMLDRDDLSTEEVKQILKVISSMLVEGPVEGLSAVGDPPGVLAKVIKASEKIPPDEEEQRIIDEVKVLSERMKPKTPGDLDI